VVDIYHPNILHAYSHSFNPKPFLRQSATFFQTLHAQCYDIIVYLLLDKKATYLNMFGPIMLDRVIGNVNC
jgi:hypothetical protein